MAASCSRYPRIARGVVGAVVGGVLGRILVAAIGIGDDVGPTGLPSRSGVASYSIPVVFAVSGAIGAAWKRDCT